MQRRRRARPKAWFGVTEPRLQQRLECHARLRLMERSLPTNNLADSAPISGMADALMAYEVMAYVVMARALMVYIVMADALMAYEVVAHVVVAHMVMGYVVMAKVVTAHVVMAHVVMAYIVMPAGKDRRRQRSAVHPSS